MVAVGIGIDFPSLYGIYDPDMLNWIHFVMNNKLTDGKGNGSGAKWDSLYLLLYKSGKALNYLDSMEGSQMQPFIDS
jgi:hypothetical protein